MGLNNGPSDFLSRLNVLIPVVGSDVPYAHVNLGVLDDVLACVDSIRNIDDSVLIEGVKHKLLNWSERGFKSSEKYFELFLDQIVWMYNTLMRRVYSSDLSSFHELYSYPAGDDFLFGDYYYTLKEVRSDWVLIFNNNNSPGETNLLLFVSERDLVILLNAVINLEGGADLNLFPINSENSEKMTEPETLKEKALINYYSGQDLYNLTQNGVSQYNILRIKANRIGDRGSPRANNPHRRLLEKVQQFFKTKGMAIELAKVTEDMELFEKNIS